MSPRRYLAIFSVTLLVGGALAMLVNFSVDPYLIFGTARIEGFNDVKADINPRVRTTKVYQPETGKWDTLIVGNSRVEMGIDPAHACFENAGWHVYNIGIPGAGVRQQLAYALNVIYQQPVERVLLSVDFVDFLVPAGSAPPEPDASPAGAGSLRFLFDGEYNPERSLASLMDRYRALLSLDALISSVRTVLLQSANQPTRTRAGFNPANDFAHAIDVEGPQALFAQKLASLGSRYQRPVALHYRDGSPSVEFANLKQFLDIAARRDIEVIVFTNPFHVEFWRLLDRLGLGDMHEEWLDLVANTVRQSPGDVVLWDFSMDSPFIHEPVPPPGVRSGPLEWFWEPAHYRKQLGDLMVDAMLADLCGNEAEFGRRLD